MVSYEQYYYTLGNVVVTANYEFSKIKGSNNRELSKMGVAKSVWNIKALLQNESYC